MAESRKNGGGESNGAASVYPDAVSDTHESGPGDDGQPGGKTDVEAALLVQLENKPDVNLIPTNPSNFSCPCHGGSYDQEGNRIAGPPVRGLDRYEFDIVNGRLILGDLYSVVKVEGSGKTAKIEKVELHGPGQHDDGPESLLYPLQPPH